MTKKADQFLRPYMFVLQEGKEIGRDLMDYRLVMLQVRCQEVVRSPTPEALTRLVAKHSKALNHKLVNELEHLTTRRDEPVRP